jgi:hypothetical protein
MSGNQQFFISKEHITACLDAVMKSSGDYETPTKAAKNIKHFEFLPPLQKLLELTEATYGFDFVPDEDGNITKVDFNWEKLRNAKALWDAIAPYVKEGSLIEMKGEDGAIWRYVFKSLTCKKVYPKIVWEE